MIEIPQNVKDALKVVNGFIAEGMEVGQLTTFDLIGAKMGAEILRKEWGSTRTVIVQAFNAMASSSLDVDSLMALAAGMHSVTDSEDNRAVFKKALTKLVREKYLRSRDIRGVRHYELAY